MTSQHTSSLSEDRGLQALRETDLSIYSVGISTAGSAEIRMAEANANRTIIATTIDEKGVVTAAERIAGSPVHSRITVKLEDVSKSLPYADETYDFVYARLVLHYLPKQLLSSTLRELHRIVKKDGKLFVVVRSNICPDATRDTSRYDPDTGMTTYFIQDEKGVSNLKRSRYFHSEDSLRGFVEAAGFEVESLTSYQEKLYSDFDRTISATHFDDLIELVGIKKDK